MTQEKLLYLLGYVSYFLNIGLLGCFLDYPFVFFVVYFNSILPVKHSEISYVNCLCVVFYNILAAYTGGGLIFK